MPHNWVKITTSDLKARRDKVEEIASRGGRGDLVAHDLYRDPNEGVAYALIHGRTREDLAAIVSDLQSEGLLADEAVLELWNVDEEPD